MRGLWTVLQPKQFFPHQFSPPESLHTLSAVLLSQAHGLSRTSSCTVWLFCSEMELPGCHLAEERESKGEEGSKEGGGEQGGGGEQRGGREERVRKAMKISMTGARALP